MNISTPDIYDQYADQVRVIPSCLNSYGAAESFYGEVVTVRCFEDNSRVKELAAIDGRGKVMIVDGGGSLKKALFGDLIAANAQKNGWQGLIFNGVVRDVDILSSVDIGIQALGATPMKTERRNEGVVGEVIEVFGEAIEPGSFVYADLNGILLAECELNIDGV